VSGSELDAHVHRADELVVVHIVKGRSGLNGITPGPIRGETAPVVVIYRRIVGVGTLNIVVVDFSRAARRAPGFKHADVFVHQALVGIVNDFIPGDLHARHSIDVADLEGMRPIPVAFSS
jgi:hypothetical protein